MKMSLYSEKNKKTTYQKRQVMILENNLHINDKIDYQKFEELFKKYGEVFSEQEFSEYFLDINYDDLKDIKQQKDATISILSKEYISTEILATVIESTKKYITENSIAKIDYNEARELYNKFGNKLDFYTFCAEALGIPENHFKKMETNKGLKISLFKRYSMGLLDIRKKQNELFENYNLHIGDLISKRQFEELYSVYSNQVLSKVFATDILQIDETSFLKFRRNGLNYVAIFLDYQVDPNIIFQIRENIISAENLHIDDEISYKRFEDLYEKYGKMLSRQMFAIDILGVSRAQFIKSSENKENIKILGDIEVSEDFLQKIKDEILQEKNFGLGKNPSKIKEFFEELYQKYGSILSKEMFLNLLLDDTNERKDILEKSKEEQEISEENITDDEIVQIRKRIIQEEGLHYDDTVDYERFRELHQKYAPFLKETVFAKEVLDILKPSLFNIQESGKNKAHILTKEKLPDSEEIQQMRRKIGLENKLHINDEIDYAIFKKLYEKYGGILPEAMFAQKILNIHPSIFEQMKTDNGLRTKILSGTRINQEEIKHLRERVLNDYECVREGKLTLSIFEQIYDSYPHILSRASFITLVLRTTVRKLKNLNTHTATPLFQTEKTIGEPPTQDKNPQGSAFENSGQRNSIISSSNAIKRSTNIQETPKTKKAFAFIPKDTLKPHTTVAVPEKEKQSSNPTSDASSDKTGVEVDLQKIAQEAKKLMSEARIILREYDFSPENIAIMKKYIDNAFIRYNHKLFGSKELDFLQESIEFVEGGEEYIEKFARICVSFMKYEKATRFISNNITSSGVTVTGKEQLRKLQQRINYAIKKVQAVNMIHSGETDVKTILNKTGVSQIDILGIRRRLNNGETLDFMSGRIFEEQ